MQWLLSALYLPVSPSFKMVQLFPEVILNCPVSTVRISLAQQFVKRYIQRSRYFPYGDHGRICFSCSICDSMDFDTPERFDKVSMLMFFFLRKFIIFKPILGRFCISILLLPFLLICQFVIYIFILQNAKTKMLSSLLTFGMFLQKICLLYEKRHKSTDMIR